MEPLPRSSYGRADRNLHAQRPQPAGAKTLPADYLNVADLLSHRGLCDDGRRGRRAERCGAASARSKRLAP
jgi:hypothetical protein